MRSRPLALCAFLAAVLVAPSSATADEDDPFDASTWPLAEVDRPVVLGPGMLEASGDTIIVNLSADQLAKPVSLAPDVRYGVSSKLTIGIDHAIGLCLGGEERGCPSALSDFTLFGLYSLAATDSMHFAVRGGLASPSVSPYAGGPQIGATLKLASGKLAAVFRPSLYIGVVGRDDATDFIDIPAAVFYQVTPSVAVSLESGLGAPLDGFGDNYRIPIAVGTVAALNERLDVGCAIGFGNAAGSGATADDRFLALRLGVRL